ncbi:MAG TPA: class I SAM-dependent methyltransferase [Chthoniobacterales bacterium]|nr:class I SAM-dependent methyltransferase [Chthoniobacterales bacterium]
MAPRTCRSCGAGLTTTFLDLGVSPLANNLIHPEEADVPEPRYPLHAHVCDHCFLVQLGEFVSPEKIFSNYPYFSSYSDTWLEHCDRYVGKMVPLLRLGPESRIVEIASNDGALLQFFRKRGLNVLGIEPAANVAHTAIEKGIPTEIGFFGRETARGIRSDFAADLIVANNVLAHVPDLNDFIAGLKLLLAPSGTITIEFPHLARLISERQFDTIYHEHFSYFSLLAAEAALLRHDLAVYDVETLATHGGSLRLFVSHTEAGRTAGGGYTSVREAELTAGLDQISTYSAFAPAVAAARQDILDFFTEARRAGKRVAGYGAAAKGSTLLNYCDIGEESMEYVVDRNPHKQRLLMPGVRLPIHAPVHVFETKPDYLFVLAWNLKEEILRTMEGIKQWGGHFVFPVPRLEII